jgi:hypothetical protein
MRGESGNETKARKGQVTLIICHICGGRGGTLVRDGEGYRHQGCRIGGRR